MKKSSWTLIVVCFLLFENQAHSQWVQTNGPNGMTVLSLAVSGGNIFAGTYGGGVFLSTNNGANWIAVNFGLTDTDVQSLAVNDSAIFEGTNGSGVFRSPLSEMIGSVMFSHNGKP